MKTWKKILGFLVSVFFLWLALRKVEWQEIPTILASGRLEYVALMFVTLAVEFLSRGYRWKILLGRQEIPYFQYLSGWVFGMFFNNVFPARAGEFVRSFYLGRKNGISSSETFGSVVLERFMDGVVVLTFIALSFNHFPIHGNLRSAGFTALGFYLTICVVLVVMQFRPAWPDAVLGVLLRPFPAGLRVRVLAVKDSFVKGFSLIRQPSRLFFSLLLSFATWGVSLLTVWLGMQVFGLSAGIWEALFLISVLSIGAMIPSSPGMIGIYEYCCILALVEVLGMNRETAITTGLFLHFFSYMCVLVTGGGLLFYENLSLKELEGEAEQQAS
jgi:hypothetical protein